MIHCCSDSPKVSPLCCFEKASHLWHQFPGAIFLVEVRSQMSASAGQAVHMDFVACVSVFSHMLWVRRPTRGGKSMRVAVATEFLPPHAMWRSASVVTYYVPFALSAAMKPTAHLFQLFSKSVNVLLRMMGANSCMYEAHGLFINWKIWYRNNFDSDIAGMFTDNYKESASNTLN